MVVTVIHAGNVKNRVKSQLAITIWLVAEKNELCLRTKLTLKKDQNDLL